MLAQATIITIDPTADIQATIDSLGTAGGIVQLGPGTYTATWVNAPANAGGPSAQRWLSGASNVTLRGQGDATKLVAPVVNAAGVVYAAIVADGCVGFRIENLQIQGSQTDDTHGAVIGIYIVGASGSTVVDRVTFAGVSASTGLNICYDIGGSVATDLGYHTVERCEVKSCIGTSTGYGLAFDVNGSSNNAIRSNRVTFLAGDGRHGVYLAGACTNNVVENNRISGGAWQAIQIYNQNTSGTISSLNVVKNNWITGSNGITVSLRTDFNEISGNTVISSNTVGIQLAGNGNDSSQLTSNNVVKGNFVYKPQNQGIHVLGTQGSLVSGNVIYGANQSQTSLGGIHVQWNGDGFPVAGVRLAGNIVVSDPAKPHREAVVIDGGHIPPGGVLVVGNAMDTGNVLTYQNEGYDTVAEGNVMSSGTSISNVVSYEDDYVMYEDSVVTDNSALSY
jgi:hypothetical protein